MVNEELLEFIRKRIATNSPKASIEKGLKIQGFSEEEIVAAFATVGDVRPNTPAALVSAVLPVSVPLTVHTPYGNASQSRTNSPSDRTHKSVIPILIIAVLLSGAFAAYALTHRQSVIAALPASLQASLGLASTATDTVASSQ